MPMIYTERIDIDAKPTFSFSSSFEIFANGDKQIRTCEKADFGKWYELTKSYFLLS